MTAYRLQTAIAVVFVVLALCVFLLHSAGLIFNDHRNPPCDVWYIWVSECAQHRPYKDCATDYPLVEETCSGQIK